MPTLNDVLAGSLQQSVQVQQIIDALKGTPNKGVPVALVSLNDQSNYALTVQNDDPTNSRALSILKADGTPFLTCDINGVSLGSPTTPVTLPTGSITSGQIADGTIATADLANNAVTNAKLGTDTARLNLLTNGGFEIWQRATTFSAPGVAAYVADRWLTYPNISGAGSTLNTVARDTANVDAGSLSCMSVTHTKSTGNSLIYSNFNGATAEFSVANKTLSCSVRVKTSTANAVRVSMLENGNVGETFSSYHTGGGTYETLSVTKAFTGSAAGNCQIRIYLEASCTAYLDNAMLVVGSVPADYAPLHPADDLARCLRYYEVIGSGSFFPMVAGYQAAGGGIYVAIPYKAHKPVASTITKVGTWSTVNCGQPSTNGADNDGFNATITATATGYAYVYSSAAGQSWTVEANP